MKTILHYLEKKIKTAGSYCLVMFLLFMINSPFAHSSGTALSKENTHKARSIQRAKEWHSSGLNSLKSGHYYEAKNKLERSIDLFGQYYDMDNLYYHYFQALILTNDSNNMVAAKNLETIKMVKPTSGRFINSFKGYMHFILGNIELSKKHLFAATTDNPTVSRVFYDAALIAYLIEDYHKAYDYVNSSLALNSNCKNSNKLLSRVSYKLNYPDEAFLHIANLRSEMFKDRSDACLFMNILSANNKPSSFLLQQFTHMIRFGKKVGHYELTALGNVYFASGRYRLAERYYEEAWQKSSKTYIEAHNLGNLFHALGYYHKAEEWYEKSISLNPDNIKSQIALVKIYINEGNKKTALDMCNNIFDNIDAIPMNFEKFILMGEVYLDNNYLNKALLCFTIARSINHKHIDVLAGLSLVHFKFKDYNMALKHVREALEIDRKNSQLIVLESTIIFYRGYTSGIINETAYRASIANLENLLKRDKNNNLAMNILLLTMAELDMYEEAHKQFENFTKKNNIDWLLHNTMNNIEVSYGTFLSLSGDTVSAKIRYQTALNHAYNAYEKSGIPFIKNNIGVTYTYLDSVHFAFPYLEDFHGSATLSNTGLAYILTGDTLEGIEFFKAALEMDSEAWYARINLAKASNDVYLFNTPLNEFSRNKNFNDGFVRMFYFSFDVKYDFGFKLWPLFHVHNPQMLQPVLDI